MKNNSNIFNKNKEAQKARMLEALKTPNIQSTSPSYGQVKTGNKVELIELNLTQLKPYDNNPRRTKNQLFDEIKESIRNRGLDHAPNVTKLPNDDIYTILDGGNTRLAALNELFRETQDPKFFTIQCVYKPYQAENEAEQEIGMLIGHLSENDLRGELIFIEKALGIQKVKELFDAQEKYPLSNREFEKRLKASGYPVSNGMLSVMERTIKLLYPYIPDVLFTGIGRPLISKIITCHNNGENAWKEYSEKTSPRGTWSEIWKETLCETNLHPSEFSLDILQDQLAYKMHNAFDKSISYNEFLYYLTLSKTEQEQREAEKEIIEQKVQEALKSEDQYEKEQQEKALQKAQREAEKSQNDKVQKSAPIQYDEDELNSENSEFLENFSNSQESDEELNLDSEDQKDSSNDMQKLMTHAENYVDYISNREERAREAGLDFQTNYKQREIVTNIWTIDPNFGANKIILHSLVCDIAEEYGFLDLIYITDLKQWLFNVKDWDRSQSGLDYELYKFISVFITDDQVLNKEAMLHLTQEMLMEVSDVALVKLMRLIRLYRVIQQKMIEE